VQAAYILIWDDLFALVEPAPTCTGAGPYRGRRVSGPARPRTPRELEFTQRSPELRPCFASTGVRQRLPGSWFVRCEQPGRAAPRWVARSARV